MNRPIVSGWRSKVLQCEVSWNINSHWPEDLLENFIFYGQLKKDLPYWHAHTGCSSPPPSHPNLFVLSFSIYILPLKCCCSDFSAKLVSSRQSCSIIIFLLFFQGASGVLKRKSISFQDSNSDSKVSKAAPAPAAKNYGGSRTGSSVYAPPTGKYSKNVGQYGKDLYF